MRCKAIEKILLEDASEKISPTMQAELAAHLATCEKCAAFKHGLKSIHVAIPEIKSRTPELTLETMTRQACHREMSLREIPAFYRPPKSELLPIPIFLWIGLELLLIISTIWSGSVINLSLNQSTLSFQLILVLVMIFQNILMLVFTPLLLKKQQFPSKKLNLKRAILI